MTIGDRIFEQLNQIGMSQKEFSEKTGISQSTISEWKSKHTNPTSEKIMIICEVLGCTPEWLLSGIENTGERGNVLPWFVIDRDSDLGEMMFRKAVSTSIFTSIVYTDTRKKLLKLRSWI